MFENPWLSPGRVSAHNIVTQWQCAVQLSHLLSNTWGMDPNMTPGIGMLVLDHQTPHHIARISGGVMPSDLEEKIPPVEKLEPPTHTAIDPAMMQPTSHKYHNPHAPSRQHPISDMCNHKRLVPKKFWSAHRADRKHGHARH